MTTKTIRNFFDLGGLFSGARQYENFWRAKELFPTRTMVPSRNPYDWPEGRRTALPETFQHDGHEKSTVALLEETDTAALLVLHDGKVCLERYALTGGRKVQWISMSVAKSFTSTLVGVAVDEGLIKSIDEPISSYVPVQAGSAYDGVSIRDVLQMSSGAKWSEAYGDSNSEVMRFVAAQDSEDFISTMVREYKPGTVFRYNSADTQVLGSLLKYATGRTITDYMQEKLYEPLGMVGEGYWLMDAAGMEQVCGGLNMTARDFAKLGELYRNSGAWHGQQIISADWVKAATTIDSSIRQPGAVNAGHTSEYGYGYQWWIPGGDRHDYAAIGIYNQYIYVDPETKVTIVKLSANPRYGLSEDPEDYRSTETIAFFRAIAQMF